MDLQFKNDASISIRRALVHKLKRGPRIMQWLLTWATSMEFSMSFRLC